LAGDGDKKKNDPTVLIVIGIGVALFLLLFGGCGQISLPNIGVNSGPGYQNNSGPGYQNPPRCDRNDCRGHYDGNGRWVPDQNAGGGNERHGSGHQRRKPRHTDESDRSDDH
jgi:hypothetical protein